MAQQNLPGSTENMNSYLHDMADLETQAFTLEQTVVDLEQGIQEILRERCKDLSQKLIDIRGEINGYENRIKDIERRIRSLEKVIEQKKDRMDRVVEEIEKNKKLSSGEIFVFVLSTILTCGVAGVIGLIVRAFQKSSLERTKAEQIKSCVQEIDGKQTELDGNRSSLRSVKSCLVKKEAEYHEVECQIAVLEELIKEGRRPEGGDPQIEFYEKQIQETNQQIEELRVHIQQLYNFNLIPPDYRTLDCVLSFQQIFKNDLADDMRGAVRIYEERVFRGEMVQGMARIYQAIGQLRGTMSFISQKIEDIRLNVSDMCQDVYQISQSMVNLQVQNDEIIASNQRIADEYGNMAEEYRKHTDVQGQLLEETKLNRYATQALQESNERLAWYEEQRRQGLL